MIDPLNEPLDASTTRRFIEQGRKDWAARRAGDAFKDWLVALSKIAEPRAPTRWIAHNVVLNEECWFDSFADGMTPAECWKEQCSD